MSDSVTSSAQHDEPMSSPRAKKKTERRNIGKKDRRMSGTLREFFGSKDRADESSPRRLSSSSIGRRLSGGSLQVENLSVSSPRSEEKKRAGSLVASAPEQTGVTKLVMKLESDRKTIQVGLAKATVVERQYLGVSLEELRARDGRTVPFMVSECLKWLWQEATREAGIFLIDASDARVKNLASRMEKGVYTSMYEEADADVAVCASLLKLFFTRLPEPLLTFDLYCAWLEWESVDDAVGLLARLPAAHLATVRTLFNFLQEVAGKPALRMGPDDIGQALGPLLLRPQQQQGGDEAAVGAVARLVREWAAVSAELGKLEDAAVEVEVEVEGLAEFLGQVGMESQLGLFHQLGVTVGQLKGMAPSDLQELGMSEEDAVRLIDEAKKRKVGMKKNLPVSPVSPAPQSPVEQAAQPPDDEEWGEDDLDPRVRRFLERLGLHSLIDLFIDCQIDWTILDMSAVSDFLELGLDEATTEKIMHGLGKDVAKSALAPRPISVADGQLEMMGPVADADVMLDPKWVVDLREIRVQKKIGIGGYAEVWKAAFKNKTVAFKLLQEETMDDTRVVDEFRREMAVMSRLDHPNIVAFYGAVDRGKSLAMVLEYAARGDLEGILLDLKTPIPYLQRLRWAKQVAQGLQYLHTRNPRVIHRDIKSANILVDELLCTKICDFGLAKRKDMLDGEQGMSLADHSRVMNVRSAAVQFTSLVGTPAWTAPELIANRSYSEKVDVYSYAVFLWELMCRQTPHEGMPHFDLAYAILARNLRPPIPDWMPETFRQLMSSCWASKAEFRPQIDVVLKILTTMLANPRHDAVELGN